MCITEWLGRGGEVGRRVYWKEEENTYHGLGGSGDTLVLVVVHDDCTLIWSRMVLGKESFSSSYSEILWR